MSLGQKILQLRSEGKTYNQIKEILQCSKATISFHCGHGQKLKNLNRNRKRRKNLHPLISKIERFQNKKWSQPKLNGIGKLTRRVEDFLRRNKIMSEKFTLQDVLDKIGDNPKCYLTGRNIDIHNTKTYHFDHILPISRGGDNSLSNLGLSIKEANLAKNNMTHDEFLQLCKDVLINHGYEIKQKERDSNS